MVSTPPTALALVFWTMTLPSAGVPGWALAMGQNQVDEPPVGGRADGPAAMNGIDRAGRPARSTSPPATSATASSPMVRARRSVTMAAPRARALGPALIRAPDGGGDSLRRSES